MVRAKFPFDATSDKQLSLKVGDVLVVLEKSASGWYKGESNGAVGLFPSNYTEPVVIAPSEDEIAKGKIAAMKAKRLTRIQASNSDAPRSPELAATTIQRLVRSKSQTKRAESMSATSGFEVVRAKFKFDSASDKQLTLKVGDLVTILEKHPSGWYKGECNGSVGMFPFNYTESVGDTKQTSGALGAAGAGSHFFPVSIYASIMCLKCDVIRCCVCVHL